MAITHYILHPETAGPDSDDLIGGKAGGLLRLARAGARVPAWFAVTTRAFHAHLQRAGLVEALAGAPLVGDIAGTQLAELERRTAALRQAIEAVAPDPDLVAAIHAALPALGPGPYAVRSSMVGEDGESHSFAGQLDTFLFQGAADVPQALLRCWASAFTARAVAYRARAGSGATLPKMGVVIQRMISGRTSGVMFTQNPLNGRRDQLLLSACWGSGEGVVSGRCNTDEFVCDRDGREVALTIADKDTQIVHKGDGSPGTEEVEVAAAKRQVRCLTPEEVAALVHEGGRLAEAIGGPLDIEWTYASDGLHVLQARPITATAPPVAAATPPAAKAIAGAPGPSAGASDGPLTVWDNSNIQESYCGVTTPLTFSYARAGYANAYEQLMRIGRLPEAVIVAQRPLLQNLLGLLNGRVYYNINNWYRMLLFLPAFRRNKADMEKMMGLDSPVDFISDESMSLGEQLRRIPWLVSVGVRMVRRFANMGREVESFITQFDAAYRRIDRRRFPTASFSQLMELVEQVRREISAHWHTPLINDLYVMMSSGRLRRLVEQAVGHERAPALIANLMGGEEGIESTEPTRQVLKMSAMARGNPALAARLREDPVDLPGLRRDHREFAAAIDRYIDRYGDRCMGELKLETVSLREDPSFLFRLLRGYLDRPDLDAQAIVEKELRLRGEAEAELRRAVGMLRFAGAMRTVRAARAAVKYRENLRLLRTLVFGLVRDLYRAIGDRLATAGRLAAARDIFYLTVEEIESYHGGTAASADLAALVQARKAEYAAYGALDLPHRIETRGAVYHGNTLGQPATKTDPEPTAGILRGTGCYPGIVDAPARIIMNPTDDLALSGRILVTLRTDPGWAPLFPLARGILVERGSTLSHSAILARELGIPAVVGVPGLLRTVRDGDRLRLDGGAGTVEKLEERR
jgi:pyruvate,water dikinase